MLGWATDSEPSPTGRVENYTVRRNTQCMGLVHLSPFIPDIHMTCLLVKKAVLRFLNPRCSVVRLLLALRLSTNPWHSFANVVPCTREWTVVVRSKNRSFKRRLTRTTTKIAVFPETQATSPSAVRRFSYPDDKNATSLVRKRRTPRCRGGMAGIMWLSARGNRRPGIRGY